MGLTFRLAAWAASLPESEVTLTQGMMRQAMLPSSLRRRASPIGQRALTAALTLLPDAGAPRVVVSSRHGDYDRTMGLLNSLGDNSELSPADFSLAVHHALAGLLSIHGGSRAGHTAIAAGLDSFGFGLMEAALACDADAEPVLLLHFDPDLPEIYHDIAEEPAADVVLALLLHPNQGAFYVLDAEASANPDGELAAQRNLARSFLQFLQSEIVSTEAAGERMNWRWSRVD